jgi:hypothetical protein
MCVEAVHDVIDTYSLFSNARPAGYRSSKNRPMLLII